MSYDQWVNGIFAFDFELREVWRNPVQKDDGVWYLVDTSGSVQKHESLLKHIWTLIFVMGKIEKIDLPSLDGCGTSLCTSVDELALLIGEGQKLVVITDGDDNDSSLKMETVVIDVGTDDAPIYSQARNSVGDEERQSDILKHIEHVIKAQLVLVALGDTVTKFVARASRVMKRTSIAHVPKSGKLSTKQVLGIVKCAVSAPRRVHSGQAPIITASTPEAQPEATGVTDEEVATVETTAKTIKVQQERKPLPPPPPPEPFTITQIQALIEEVEEAKKESAKGTDKLKIRAALLWFMNQCIKNPEVGLPGAVIGAKQQRAYFSNMAPADANERSSLVFLNEMLSALAGKGVLKSMGQMDSTVDLDEIDGKEPYSTNFKRSVVYTASEKLLLDPEIVINMRDLPDFKDYATPMDEMTRSPFCRPRA